MTGFARVENHDAAWSWGVEIKGVNGRNLDIRCRLPQGFDQIEGTVRSAVGRHVKRGSITVTVSLSRVLTAASGLRLNQDVLSRVLALGQELQNSHVAAPTLDGLLRIPGVIDTGESETAETRAALETTLLAAVEQGLERLAQMRRAEGAALMVVLLGHLEAIANLRQQAVACAAAQPHALRERMRSLLAALTEAVPALPEERLAQEVALLVAKGDIREELDRLEAHVEAARQMLREGGAVGRRLDFLCQEFTRESNTLCAKSGDMALTRIGLALKAAVEQLREQVQNIE